MNVPRRARHDSPEVAAPRRTRHDSPDMDVPRRTRHDSPDMDVPRRTRHDSPDMDVPRRARHDSPDMDVPRRAQQGSESHSVQRQSNTAAKSTEKREPVAEVIAFGGIHRGSDFKKVAEAKLVSLLRPLITNAHHFRRLPRSRCSISCLHQKQLRRVCEQSIVFTSQIRQSIVTSPAGDLSPSWSGFESARRSRRSLRNKRNT
jgi:hypothetical protein